MWIAHQAYNTLAPDSLVKIGEEKGCLKLICMQNKANSFGCISHFILPPNQLWKIKSEEKAPVLPSSKDTPFFHPTSMM